MFSVKIAIPAEFETNSIPLDSTIVLTMVFPDIPVFLIVVNGIRFSDFLYIYVD